MKDFRVGPAGVRRAIAAALICPWLFLGACSPSIAAPEKTNGPGNRPTGGETTASSPMRQPDLAADPIIVDRPITFNDERKRLTLDYIHMHYDPKADRIEIVPRMIVLHWTANCTLDGTWRTFDRVRMDPGNAYLARFGAVNLSSHFLVDRDGTIYRLVPETIMARHVIGMNLIAIGVENVGTDTGCTLTQKQVEADAALVRYLVKKYPAITYLIGHYESESFRGTPVFVDLMPGYATPKIDPGREFMTGVRERVKDLGLMP